jgi:uncharacterized protein (TIGR02145 family)
MEKHIPILFLFLFLALFPALALFSQSPQGIPYQAVMRNADGTVMAISAVNMTFMIHDGTAIGTIVYQESHALTSNAQGLVSCVVGNGVVSQGNFNSINWGNGAKFLHVMMGTTDLGTQQMLSVPYALYAGNTAVGVSATGDTLTVGGHNVIVPGISAANPINIYNQGTGVTDIDGYFYPSIIINGQEWMQRNLTVTKYRNGDLIPTGLSDASWVSTISGAYAIYYNDWANNILYGKLYNWHAVNDSRGICPTGWHVPSDEEWSAFINYLDPIADGGTNDNMAGGKMKSDAGWNYSNSESTNESGFTGLPGGSRMGPYFGFGIGGQWWSITESEYNPLSGMAFEINDQSSRVYRFDANIQNGFSVRCVRDSEIIPVQGCTDNTACNYNGFAIQNDNTCMYLNATCDDWNASTTDDVINGNCVCSGTQISGSATGGQLLPGNVTCATQNISVTGCGGKTSLTYDGRTYNLVEIGGQCWFANNLATDQYLNGDAIPTGLDNFAWLNTTAGAYAVYNNDPAYDANYGKLYNWFTTVDSRGLCPAGWHVPTDCDWMYLEGSLGMSVTDQEIYGGFRGLNEGGALKATTDWTSPNTGATNSSGFTAFPGGYRYLNYTGVGTGGLWWSSTESDLGSGWGRSILHTSSLVSRNGSYGQAGYSVRCVRD